MAAQTPITDAVNHQDKQGVASVRTRAPRLPMRGTLLNTSAVAIGALIGLAIGRWLPAGLLSMATTGLGLVTIGIGVKLFLESKNVLVVAIAIGIGGVVGKLLGIEAGLEGFAEFARQRLGGGGSFNEALITTSVLFCVGPMTLLGCMQDALENKIELLALKAVMDGIASVFFAAALGPGVLVTAGVVLVTQGALTLMAGRLGGLKNDAALLAETTAVGGPILMAIGLGLADIKKFPSENFLPALVLAPIVALLFRRFTNRAPSSDPL